MIHQGDSVYDLKNDRTIMHIVSEPYIEPCKQKVYFFYKENTNNAKVQWWIGALKECIERFIIFN